MDILFWILLGIFIWQVIILITYVLTQNKKTTLFIGYSFAYGLIYFLIKIAQFIYDYFTTERGER